MSNFLIKGIISGDDFVTETILTGLALNENLSEYWIVAQNENRCNELRHKYNINAMTNFDLVDKADILILTFKYEDTKEMLSKIAGRISKNTLIISIIPGIALKFVSNFFTDNEVIRLTLNPSIISGQGLAAYIANANATDKSKKVVHDMLAGFSKIIEVSNEDEFEKVRRFIFANTFLSYVLVKSLIDAGTKVGFSTEQAGLIVDQILKGASKTLIDFQNAGNEMLKDGLRNKKFTNHAIELIREYGIYDSLERYLTMKETTSLFEADNYSVENNINLNYNWFERMVRD